MKECCDRCISGDIGCPIKNCKYWISYENDLNCSLIAIDKHGPMTLREISDRLQYTIPRIKQVQDEALAKINIMISTEKETH